MPSHAVILRPQLHSRHVLHANDSGIGSLTNHDLFELRRGVEPALRANRVSEGLSRRDRLAAYLTRGVNGVLRLNRGDNLGHRDSQLRQLIGLYPQAHRVLAGAEDLYRTNT